MKKNKRVKTKKDDIRLTINFTVLGLCFLSIILLFFKPTRDFLYGVFGYSIYVYILASIIYLVLSFTGWIKKFNSKTLVSIVLLILSILSTIHVGTNKQIIKDPNSNYITAPYYAANTVGGLMMSLLSYVFIAISRDYGFVLTCVFILMATILLMTIYPLILMIGRGSRVEKKVCIRKNSMPTTDQPQQSSYENDEKILLYNDELPHLESNVSSAHKTLFSKEMPSKDEKRSLFESLTSDEEVRARVNKESAEILFNKNKPVETTKKESFKILNDLEDKKADVLSDQRPRSSEDILFGNHLDVKQTLETRDFNFDSTEKPKNMETLFGAKDEINPSILEEQRQDKLSALDYITKPYDQSEYDKYVQTSPFTRNAIEQLNEENKGRFAGNTNIKSSEIYQKQEDISSQVSVTQTSFDDFVTQDISRSTTEKPFSSNDNFKEPLQEPKASELPLWKSRLKEKRENSIIEKAHQISLDEHLESLNEVTSISTESNEKSKEKIKIKRKYNPPPVSLLTKYGGELSPEPENYEFIKARIDQTMAEFDVPANVINAQKGPTFTRYELELGDGYKVTRLSQLIDNLKMRLEVKNIRLLAPIGGKNAFGLEIPNKKRLTVGLREIIESARFSKQTDGIDLCFGMTNDGDKYIADLSKMPHMLVAGASGTGKSVFLNCVIIGLLYKYSPEDLRIILVDPKRVELNKYKGIPHLLIPDTIKEYQEAVNALKILVKEMDDRYKILENSSCANITEYNQMFPNKKMHKIVLIVDEMADLMMKSKGSTEFEDYVVRIAQLARAAGIHMILATQRPVVEVITGLIKSNITSRVAFTVQNGRDSSIILDETGAEELLMLGDMLFSSPTSGGLVRMQGAYVSSQEIMDVCNYIKANNEADFDDELLEKIAHNPNDDIVAEVSAGERAEEKKMQRIEDDEELAKEVLRFFILRGNGSISSAQTKFGIGYVKAKRIVEMLGERGYLGPETKGSTPRTIEITIEELENLIETGTF